MSGHISYRDVTESDRSFLLDLYRSTRLDVIEHGGHMSMEQKENFVRSQFELQDIHYKKYFPGTLFKVIRYKSRDVGRLYTYENDALIEVLDITLEEKERGNGLGHKIMSAIINDAHKKNKNVRIYVEKNNRAISFYDRLGFTITGDEGISHQMTLVTMDITRSKLISTKNIS